jgi:uncharacterized protein VirK/YbjX
MFNERSLQKMDKERIQLIVRNLELLIDSLKAEIYSDVESYRYDDVQPMHVDYDEIFEDDDN